MTQDNRIRFPSTLIDFANDVGVTGQDHDTYPQPNTQARYDHMRMTLIGLLAQQSSLTPPSQYRDGTPWFDLNTMQLKIYSDGSWVPYSDVIMLDDGDGNITSLSDWYQAAQAVLSSLSSEITFSGTVVSTSTTLITIPESLRTYIYSDSRVFVYKNGVLLDPRTTRIDSSSSYINLSQNLVSGDSFTVMIRRMSSGTWYSSSVSI